MTGPTGLAVEWAGAGPTIAFLHGFTQTARSWTTIASAFAADHRTALVDLPGHGDSAHVVASLDRGADLIASAVGPAIYVGYSLGGRHALHVALRHPDHVRGLVLIGATAGLESPEDRTARIAGDEALAQDLERDGIEAFLDRWLALPLFAGLPADAAGRADRLRNRAAGLAASLRHAGTGTQEPSWDRLGSLTMPVLVVAGEHDTKFRAIGERLASAIGPTASFETVGGAGHSAHLERPDAVRSRLAAFVASIG